MRGSRGNKQRRNEGRGNREGRVELEEVSVGEVGGIRREGVRGS